MVWHQLRLMIVHARHVTAILGGQGSSGR
jgi:hypothetical protein